MLSRFLTILAVMVLVSACTTTDEAAMDAQAEAEREQITDGPLADIYDQELEGPAPGTQADLAVNVGDRVFFGFDRYDLTPEARQTLEQQAAWLKQYPSIDVVIEGHTDERGTREYNLALGERRANSAMNYLAALGISPSRITTISYGKERPAVPGSNEQAWAQNRRAVTVVE